MLDGFDFAPVPSRDGDEAGVAQQTRNTLLVEFLTPSFEAEEGLRPLKALGVAAQSLHFLSYLIADLLKAAAVYRSGVLLQIPRPESFAIHKLIVADCRRGGPDSLKSRNERMQAAFLIEVLAKARPEDLQEAYADVLSRGPHWPAHLNRSIARSPQITVALSRFGAAPLVAFAAPKEIDDGTETDGRIPPGCGADRTDQRADTQAGGR